MTNALNGLEIPEELIDSDDEWEPEGERGEAQWMEHINEKVRKEKSSLKFKIYVMR